MFLRWGRKKELDLLGIKLSYWKENESFQEIVIPILKEKLYKSVSCGKNIDFINGMKYVIDMLSE